MLTKSPWLTMWLTPRRTIRRLIDDEQRGRWIPVVALTGLQQALVWAKGHAGHASPSTTILLAIFFGGIQLVYGILIGPFLLAIVGGWLGGEADADDLREAVAWSLVPQAEAVVLWIPLVAAFGWKAFAPPEPPLSTMQLMVIVLWLLVPIATFWSVVIQIGAIAAVQRFSIFRAILSQVILALPLLVLIALTR